MTVNIPLINEEFTDEEILQLEARKGTKDWHDFIMMLVELVEPLTIPGDNGMPTKEDLKLIRDYESTEVKQ